MRTCVFPVAGLGTRFLPATKSIPKEMLTVGDKPLIDYAVAEAKACGVERFIFVTSTGKEAIEDYFDRSVFLEEWLKDREKHEQLEAVRNSSLEPGQAVFVRQPIPLGLGHAVWCARNWIDDESFGVILADDFIMPSKQHQPCLAQMHESYNKGDGNMAAVMEVSIDHVHRYGIMKPETRNDNKLQACDVIEKPSADVAPSQTAVIGRYILARETLEELDRMHHNEKRAQHEEMQLTNALRNLLPNTPLTGYYFKGQRLDCGTKEGWLEANSLFRA